MKNKGILLPVSSLPGHHGIGDMGEYAYEFIRWLDKRGFNYWQILPINPLGPGWSPYMTTCSEAIDYRYINLDDLVKDGLLKQVRKFHPTTTKALYQESGEFKKRALKKAFKQFKKDHLDELLKFQKKEKWVIKYALFNIFYEKNNKKPWNEWPHDEMFYLENHKVGEYPKQYKQDVLYLTFEQYIAYKQWHKLLRYAHRYNIKIIGDLPFYVGYSSSDCWANKDVFNLDENTYVPKTVAGCPPDGFSEDGQLWGNPTFNFDKMKENNYKFYVDRLGAVAKLCDVVRLDHFRAFDAYYAIPYGAKNARVGEWKDGPRYGFFDAFFKKYSHADIIAEDLGFMTDQVYELRDHYHLPGMIILQHAIFDPNTKDNGNMIVYTGTHDNFTIKHWYDTLDQNGRNYVANYIGADPNQDLLKQFMEYVFKRPSKITIIPMQDYLLLDNSARLNAPGTFGSPNWEWKLAKLPLK